MPSKKKRKPAKRVKLPGVRAWIWKYNTGKFQLPFVAFKKSHCGSFSPGRQVSFRIIEESELRTLVDKAGMK